MDEIRKFHIGAAIPADMAGGARQWLKAPMQSGHRAGRLYPRGMEEIAHCYLSLCRGMRYCFAMMDGGGRDASYRTHRGFDALQ